MADPLDNLDEAQLLQEARLGMLRDLTTKARAGTITHQEMAVLRNLLRDNGIILTPKDPETIEADKARRRADLPRYGEQGDDE